METRPFPENNRPADWAILMIDDDEDDFVIVREMLSNARGRKHEIEWAPSYAAGQMALLSKTYSAVLVDYDLGQHSGIELIREANERGYAAPFILYTGRGSFDVDVEAMQAGATLYLTKNEANPLLLERAIRYAIERKQAEKALHERNELLRQSEEKFARAFQYNPAAMTIIRASDSRHIDANECFCRLSGYTREEVLAHTPIELGFFTQPVRLAIWDEYTRMGYVHQHEAPMISRDGSVKHVLFSMDSIEVSGEPSILATLIDITERKQVEAALQETSDALRNSELRMREFLENTHDNFLSLDRDWRFTYANRHFGQVMNVDPRELIGKNYWELFPQYLGTELEKNYRRVMAEGAPLHYRQGGIYTKSTYDISVYPTHEGVAIFSIDRTEEQRRQQELEAERARLEAVLQALPVGVWITDSNGAGIGKNQEADKIWAGDAPLVQSVEQYQEYPSWDSSGKKLTVEDYPLTQVLRTGQPVKPVEHRIQRFDGSTGFVLVSATPILDAEGQVAGAVAINLDITAAKMAEEALRANAEALKSNADELRRNAEARLKSEEKFARSFRSSPVAIAISTVAEGRFIEVNDSYTQLYGFSREELIGHTSVELGLFPDPVARKEVIRRFREENGFKNMELHLQSKSGEAREVLFSTEPIEADGLECMLSLVVDITERKKAEAALKANAEALKANAEALEANAEALERSMERERARAHEMETLMDTVPALIWIAHDRECHEMTGNRYGYEFLNMWQGANISKTAGEEDLNLQPYRNFKDGREIPTEELPMQVAAAMGQPASNYDFDLVFNDGAVRTVLGNVNPLFDENGQPNGAVAAFMDITDFRQAQVQLKANAQELERYSHELERSNQALQDFALIASHDLQEPLRKIQLFGNVLNKQLKGTVDESAVEYLTRMQNAAERMQAMINGLLELSRVNTRGAEFTRVQLGDLVKEVVSDLEARIQAVQGQVQIDALPEVEADALQMRQLFQNLIGNAIKFHKPGVPPRVSVSGLRMEAALPCVEIRVADNGIGFEPEQSERIFQPFHRLHSRSEYEGTGLGLAICQKIVERHHGQIQVESKPGEGSVFVIRMPAKGTGL